MLNAETTSRILAAVANHDGNWGWYQLERAFPPGSLPDPVRAIDVLKNLEDAGFICRVPGEPHERYRLTERGKQHITAKPQGK